jgi:hypothetical protein
VPRQEYFWGKNLLIGVLKRQDVVQSENAFLKGSGRSTYCISIWATLLEHVIVIDHVGAA